MKQNFKELNSILSNQEDLEEIYNYLHEWKLAILKRESIQGLSDLSMFKKIHCCNLLRHLGLKRKGIKQNFEVIYRNFFKGFDDRIYEYFRRKTKEE